LAADERGLAGIKSMGNPRTKASCRNKPNATVSGEKAKQWLVVGGEWLVAPSHFKALFGPAKSLILKTGDERFDWDAPLGRDTRSSYSAIRRGDGLLAYSEHWVDFVVTEAGSPGYIGI
jgi:hypothetical protein